jgi:hypothetical protein
MGPARAGLIAVYWICSPLRESPALCAPVERVSRLRHISPAPGRPALSRTDTSKGRERLILGSARVSPAPRAALNPVSECLPSANTAGRSATDSCIQPQRDKGRVSHRDPTVRHRAHLSDPLRCRGTNGCVSPVPGANARRFRPRVRPAVSGGVRRFCRGRTCRPTRSGATPGHRRNHVD